MSKGGSNIYKRKDGRWEGRYIKSRAPDGKAIYGYVYGDSYQAVQEKLPPSYRTDAFEVFAGKWFDSVYPVVKPQTANKYRNILKLYLYPQFTGVILKDITNARVTEFCNKLLISGGVKGEGLKPKTVADIMSVFKLILKYADPEGNVLTCDIRSFKVKRHQKELRVLTRSEQQLLCEELYTDLEHGNIGILVSLFTGLRLGEVCALRWEDISLEHQMLRVRRTMQRIQVPNEEGKKTKVVIMTPKSACSIRNIPIPDRLAEILAVYRKAETGYLLTNSDSVYIEPRTLQNQWKRVLKKCRIESANYHALRHTFATRCVELGFDVKSLSEILGHATVNITMNRYVHPSMELKNENMQRLSQLFAANTNERM